ncbi:transcriptional regulator ATRX, partial [Trifolium pratense]
MAEEDIQKQKNDDDVQSQIQTAMRSRVPHFKQQANSLTFEGVRRLLEKDLGLEQFSLDLHKRFIKECLKECLEDGGDDDAPKVSGEEGEKGESTQETEEQKEELQSKDEKDLPEDKEKMEDSPVLGLLKEQKEVKQETKKEEPSENLIKKAIRKRASYLKANAEYAADSSNYSLKVTYGSLRRLLEEDLKLDKFTLDPYKKFINKELDEVLTSSEAVEPAKSAKKIVKKKPDTKVTKKASTEENSDNSDEASEEEDSEEDEVKPKRKSVPKGKMQTPVGAKKRKGEETNLPSKKRVKPNKAAAEDNSDAEDDRKNSEDDQSHSSAENTTKKKEVSTPVYSKRVEHLKSVIKACGMSVPPVIYKKVKQVPENKREGQLIKELEEILSREGLSSNPSEKEIKEVNRKKARAKELEGIDTSNIVSSTRRRASISFAPPPPPKPKIPVETSGKDTK